MSEVSDMYEFKMALFDNVNPNKFLLFRLNYQMVLRASGNITEGEKSIVCIK